MTYLLDADVCIRYMNGLSYDDMPVETGWLVIFDQRSDQPEIVYAPPRSKSRLRLPHCHADSGLIERSIRTSRHK